MLTVYVKTGSEDSFLLSTDQTFAYKNMTLNGNPCLSVIIPFDTNPNLDPTYDKYMTPEICDLTRKRRAHYEKRI